MGCRAGVHDHLASLTLCAKMDKPYYKINEYFLYGIGQWPGQSKFAQILISLVLLLDMSSLLLVEVKEKV